MRALTALGEYARVNYTEVKAVTFAPSNDPESHAPVRRGSE